MDLQRQLQDCFEKLGYTHTFPTLNLNPSTTYVWQQLLNKLKPKDEIGKIRKNIIINRLNKKQTVEDPLLRPIPEIKVYVELKHEKDKVSKLNTSVQEKHSKIVCLLETTRAHYLLNSSLKNTIEEKKLRFHTMRLKCDNIQSDIKQIQAMLDEKDNSLISEEDSLSQEFVQQLFHKTLDKIDKLVNVQYNHNQTSLKNNSMSVPFKRPCYSSIKKAKFSETRRNFGSLTSARSLFGESFKENQMNFDNVQSRKDEFSLNKSAELLPESCFDFKPDEEFLTTFKSRESDEDSVCDFTLNMGSQIATQFRKKWELFEEAIGNKDVGEGVTKLFEEVNRRVLWNSLCSVRESVLDKIRIGLGSCQEKIRSINVETNEEDLAKLRFIIIKYNLKALKSKKINEKLKRQISERKLEIEKYLKDHIGDDRLKTLEWKLDEIRLESDVKFIQEEINNNERTDSLNTIRSLNSKIKQSKGDMLCRVKEIGSYMESKEILMEKLRKCKDDTFTCARKLSKFLRDSSWASVLCENLHSCEMEAFKRFSFECNKAFWFTLKDFYYKDCLGTVTVDGNTSSDDLHVITSLLETPQRRPEWIISEACRKKDKLKCVQTLEFPEINVEESRHSLEELEERDNYVVKACEAFAGHMRSSKTYHVLNTPSRMKLTMDLWLEMPFKEFISDRKLVEGKTYKSYEIGRKK